MTTVLLTGASGFIAGHVLKLLLEKGYIVKATVRSQSKADYLKGLYPADSKLTFVIVPDIAVPGAFDEAVKGVDYILHTASPFHFKVTDPVKDMLDPAVKGTTGILEATKKFAPQVKRVVITSSFAAILDGSKGNWPEHTYTEADWNPVTWEQAIGNDIATTYVASKTFAEKAAWDFVKNERPNFELTVINPPYVWGPMLQDATPESVNTSNAIVFGLINGSQKVIPSGPTGASVDVRDVAEAHVRVLEVPEAAGQRYFIVSDKFTPTKVAGIIKKHFPDVKLPESNGEPEPEFFKVSNEKSKKELGLKYIPLEQTIIDLTKQLLQWVK